MHSSHRLREGARAEIVRDNMGHANIDVTQNVYGKNWWEEPVDAVTQAVEAVTNAAQNTEKEEKRISLNPSATNRCPVGCPSRRPELQVVGDRPDT
jgi:hypothetical protein